MGLFDRGKDKDKDKDENKPRADFSNVESGSSSTAPETPASPDQTYVVQSGDTLWAIAERFYGNGGQWPKIHQANLDRIEDPDMIQPGWELSIPAADIEEEGGSL